jgi:hypothetical protein
MKLIVDSYAAVLHDFPPIRIERVIAMCTFLEQP